MRLHQIFDINAAHKKSNGDWYLPPACMVALFPQVLYVIKPYQVLSMPPDFLMVLISMGEQGHWLNLVVPKPDHSWTGTTLH
jgi:hypothetical protein